MAFRPSFFSPTLFSETVSTLAAAVRNSLRPCRTYSSSRGAARGEVSTSVSTTARERRKQRTALLRRNRTDPELERAARTGTLSVPLDQVQREWQAHRGLDQLMRAGHHFNIYQDLYGGRVFRPRGFMEVAYGEKTVHRGTILSPTEASQPPRVSGLPREGLCSLVLSNPDGHLLNHNMELLHWMILNISGGAVSSGEEVVPYLQPVPPQGSGLHRLVFTLYTHSSPITVDDSLINQSGESWLDQRTFSMAEFLSACPSLQPFTFSLFQSLWDSSVHTAYIEDLVYPEPVYGVERDLTPRRRRQENTRLLKANHYRLI
jgi:large subunit ribosomal protein L38